MFSFNKPATAGAAPGGQANSLFGQQGNQAGVNQGTGFSFGQSNSGINNSGGGLNFGAQNQGQAPGASGGNGMFGNTTNASSTTGAGGFSFGQQAKKQAGGSLFGGSSGTAANGGSTGLFGNSSSNTGSGGIFGSGNTNTNSNPNTNLNSNSNSNPSGGLFGAKPQGTSLFGQNNAASTGGGLFGSTNTAGGAGGGLFGTNNTGTGIGGNQLFGGSNTGLNKGLFGAKPTGGSLTGNSTFGGSTGGGLFGAQQGQLFQQQQQQQTQETALNAICQLPLTPITKVMELPPQLRAEIEQLDQYIQRQVQISQHLKADTAEHKELIDSIPSDIAYLFKTESFTSQSLAQDLKKISSIKDTTDRNIADSQTFSMILQQLLTPGSKISSNELDKFFHNRIQTYHNKLDDYFHVLADIESAVNGIDTDVVGGYSDSFEPTGGRHPGSDSPDLFAVKTGVNALVSTVIEEFKLFMDTAERIAELHQKVKELEAENARSII